MDTKVTKFIVLNNTLALVTPVAACYPSKEAPHKEPHFETYSNAQEFCEWLASKNRDQAYHVFELVGTAITETAPVKWVKRGNRA